MILVQPCRYSQTLCTDAQIVIRLSFQKGSSTVFSTDAPDLSDISIFSQVTGCEGQPSTAVQCALTLQAKELMEHAMPLVMQLTPGRKPDPAQRLVQPASHA